LNERKSTVEEKKKFRDYERVQNKSRFVNQKLVEILSKEEYIKIS